MNLATTLATLAPLLHGSALSALADFSEAEVYEACNRAAEKLARTAQVWAERVKQAALAGGAAYLAHERAIDVQHVSLDGVTLRPATVPDLNARDENWQDADPGTPTHFALDVDLRGTVTLFPKPEANGELAIVSHTQPATITAAAAVVAMPPPVALYLALRTLAELRRKDTPGQMLEVSAEADRLADVLEQAFVAYWGRG